MYLRHEVEAYELEPKGVINIERGISCVVAILDDEAVVRGKIKDDQWTGWRLLELKKLFGWKMLLSELITPRAIRRMPKKVFGEIFAYVEMSLIYIQKRKLSLMDLYHPTMLKH